jgi:Zn-finger nucleic acid-binding protein
MNAPDRLCPFCDASLHRLTEVDVRLDRCPDHGTWFDGGELRVFAQRHGVDPIYEDSVRARADLRYEPPRRCPSCGDNGLHAADVDALLIHVCDSCHGFFAPIETMKQLRHLEESRRSGPPGQAALGTRGLLGFLDLFSGF